MTTHLDHFRETLDAHNTDSCWEVFADWLEQNGDERGEWVRKFAECNHHPKIFQRNSGSWACHHLLGDYLRRKGYTPNDVYFTIREPTPLDALISLADACIAAEAEEGRVA